LVQTIVFLCGLVLLSYMSIYQSLKSPSLVLFLWLFYLLFTGTSQIQYFDGPAVLDQFVLTTEVLNTISKIFLSLIVVIGTILYFRLKYTVDDLNEWKIETTVFFKQIFPLIIVGVIVVGIFRYLLPANMLGELIGQNTLVANGAGVIFGIVLYFPTLMEVPIARLFLDLGAARGPLLAYLLADPELSFQSIMVIKRYLGRIPTITYILLVFISALFAGMIFGVMIGENWSVS